VPGCEEDAETVHHFLKQSTYPEYREDPDCGMGCCGRHHALVERDLRCRPLLEVVATYYPCGRYRHMIDKMMADRERKVRR
jgi:hypothetical protein